MEDILQVANYLEGQGLQLWRPYLLKSIGEMHSWRNDLDFCHGDWVVRYLCLKKAAPQMRVARVEGVQNAQH